MHSLSWPPVDLKDPAGLPPLAHYLAHSSCEHPPLINHRLYQVGYPQPSLFSLLSSRHNPSAMWQNTNLSLSSTIFPPPMDPIDHESPSPISPHQLFVDLSPEFGQTHPCWRNLTDYEVGFQQTSSILSVLQEDPFPQAHPSCSLPSPLSITPVDSIDHSLLTSKNQNLDL